MNILFIDFLQNRITAACRISFISTPRSLLVVTPGKNYKDKKKKHRQIFFPSPDIYKRMNVHKKNTGFYFIRCLLK
jgi:hypothetical protein